MRASAPVVVLVVLLTLLLGGARDAEAGGAVVSRRAPSDGAAGGAALVIEQSLLVWDQETGIEDLVREARFDRARGSFAFVVPTPTRPEVFPVPLPPFDGLRSSYAFDSGLTNHDARNAPGSEAPSTAIEVLSEQRIGKLTASVLSPQDPGTLERWLRENGLSTTKDEAAWVEHYVARSFFFVVLRSTSEAGALAGSDAGAAGDGDGLTSETVRIRFKTPHPYYPYMEPAIADSPASPSRLLMLWTVTREPMVAVCHSGGGARPSITQPWTAGRHYKAKAAAVKKAVGELASIIPDGADLHLQTHRDLRPSRRGFGDVLLVPTLTVKLGAAEIAERRFLLPVLDPELLRSEAPAPPAATSPSGCSVRAPSRLDSTSGLLGVCAFAAIAARRRIVSSAARALVLALGTMWLSSLPACRKTPVADEANAESARAEREKVVLSVLGGDVARVIVAEQPPPPPPPWTDITLNLADMRQTPNNDSFGHTLVSAIGRLRTCYRSPDRPPRIGIRILVEYAIGARGNVVQTSLKATPTAPADFLGCIDRELRRMTFVDSDGAKTAKGSFTIHVAHWERQGHE